MIRNCVERRVKNQNMKRLLPHADDGVIHVRKFETPGAALIVLPAQVLRWWYVQKEHFLEGLNVKNVY